ncbi:MAG: hypothetical protein ACI9UN_005407, partial [Granulosicoccus sp.]
KCLLLCRRKVRHDEDTWSLKVLIDRIVAFSTPTNGN